MAMHRGSCVIAIEERKYTLTRFLPKYSMHYLVVHGIPKDRRLVSTDRCVRVGTKGKVLATGCLVGREFEVLVKFVGHSSVLACDISMLKVL